jgi:glycosyltransferase involved in cell wall biosynthesis
MKIMLLVETYPPEINVAGIRFQEMVSTFSRQKDARVRVVVFNPLSAGGSQQFTRVSDNVEIVRYDRKYLPKVLHTYPLINPLTIASWIYISLKEISGYKPDFVISSVPGLAPSIASYVSSKICGHSYGVDFRDNWLNPQLEDYIVSLFPRYGKPVARASYKLAFWLFKRSCRNASLISTVYDTMADDIRGIAGPGKPIAYIPNGINVEEIESVKNTLDKRGVLNKYGIPSDEMSRSIIFIGMVGGYYRPQILFDALKKINKNGVKLRYLVVGDGNLKGMMDEAIKKEGLEEQVFMLGNKSHKEVIELLLSSDIAFFPLDKDFPVSDCLLGVKVLEYVACKLPILSVSNDNATVSRFIFEHGLGTAISWENQAEMGSAIEKLLDSNEYSCNIDKYYPEFLNTYNRSTNNKILYDTIYKLYSNRH